MTRPSVILHRQTHVRITSNQLARHAGRGRGAGLALLGLSPCHLPGQRRVLSQECAGARSGFCRNAGEPGPVTSDGKTRWNPATCPPRPAPGRAGLCPGPRSLSWLVPGPPAPHGEPDLCRPGATHLGSPGWTRGEGQELAQPAEASPGGSLSGSALVAVFLPSVGPFISLVQAPGGEADQRAQTSLPSSSQCSEGETPAFAISASCLGATASLRVTANRHCPPARVPAF